MTKKSLMVPLSAMSIALLMQLPVNNAASGVQTVHADSTKPVTITFVEAMGGGFGTELQALTTKFEKLHPNIHVNLVFASSSYTTEQQKVTAMLAAHQPPTMAQVKETTETAYYSDGLLEPMSNLLSKSTIKDIVPVWKSDSSYKGKLMSVPFNKSAYVLYYNVDDFKKAGIKTPPKTWSQLEQDAIQIKQKTGVDGLGIQASYYTFELLLKQAGGEILNGSSTQAAFGTPAGKRALSFMRKLAINDKSTMVVSANAYITDGFNSGEYAMDFDSSAALPYLNNPNLHYKAAPLPKGKQLAVQTGGTNIVVFNGATDAQKQAAGVYLNYLLSVPSTIDWAENTGYLPVRESALTSPKWKSYIKTHPIQAIAPTEMKNAYVSPRVAAMGSGITEVSTQIGNMLDGQQTALQTLNNMVQAVNTALSGN